MSNIIQNVDLSHPLTDHPIWRDVKGVWIPCGNTAGGNTLYDLGPYGNHASQSDSTKMPKWVGTERGIGLDCDNVDDSLSSLFSAHLVCSKECTYVVCASSPQTSSAYVFGHEGSAFIGYIRLNSDGTISTAINTTDNGFTNSTGFTGSIDANEIIFAVFTYASADQKFYLNGSLSNSATNLTGDIAGGNSARVMMSGFVSNYSNHVNCASFLFARALSAAEIAFLYEQSLTDYLDLIRQTPTRRYFFFRKAAYYIPSGPGPRQATAEDVVGDNDGVLAFDDTVSCWSSDVPDVPNVSSGLSLEFDGSSDYVNVSGIGDTLQGLTKWTVCGWVKVNSLSQNASPFFGDARIGSQPLCRNSGGHWQAVAHDGTEWIIYNSNGPSVSVGVWTHLCLRRGDPSDLNTLYVNGVAYPQSAVTTGGALTNNSNNRIGGGQSISSILFDGLIDDVRVYDVALTQSDITNLYNGIEPSTEPISRWTMDDGPQGTPSVGDGIATWQSRDGSRKIFSQATASKRPTYYLDSNNKAWLTYDGSDDYLKLGEDLMSGTATAFFIAVDGVSQTGAHMLFATSDEATDTKYYAVAVVNDKITVYQHDGSTLMTLTGSTALAGGKHIIGIFSDGTTTTCTLDGNDETLTGTDTGNTWGDAPDRDNVTVGALVQTAVNSPADAKIARLLAYDKQLTTDEKASVSKKLKTIYSVS